MSSHQSTIPIVPIFFTKWLSEQEMIQITRGKKMIPSLGIWPVLEVQAFLPTSLSSSCQMGPSFLFWKKLKSLKGRKVKSLQDFFSYSLDVNLKGKYNSMWCNLYYNFQIFWKPSICNIYSGFHYPKWHSARKIIWSSVRKLQALSNIYN